MVKYVNMADIFSRSLARAKPLAKPGETKRSNLSPALGAAAADQSAQSAQDNPYITNTHSACVETPATTGQPDPIALVELFFFAYRDFTGEPDAILAEYQLGRAHHRVLHFVNRNPGLRVANLLELLKVTKQSLARVLKTLVDQGWVEQISGADDRRERLLYLTSRGTALADRLAQTQKARVQRALSEAGADSGETVQKFLFQMIGATEREHIGSVLNPAAVFKSKA